MGETGINSLVVREAADRTAPPAPAIKAPEAEAVASIKEVSNELRYSTGDNRTQQSKSQEQELKDLIANNAWMTNTSAKLSNFANT